MSVETARIKKVNDAPERPTTSKYVLYWAQMNRRVDSNHALLWAIELANKFKLPVLFYEGLTCNYQYANDRLHTFVLQGVPETARRLHRCGIGYAFYLRKTNDSPNNILYKLAENAAAVVTDDYPTFIARKNNETVPAKLNVAYYIVDSSCIVPMSLMPHRQYGAYTMRPRINRILDTYLKAADSPIVNHRFTDPIPSFHTEVTDSKIAELVAACDIDHSVKPSPIIGGRLEAEKRLQHFLAVNLRQYATGRNEPAARVTSGLSPFLHFGQISSLEVALAAKQYAEEHKLIAAEFLEELIVRRELAFNYARWVADPGDLANLPDWCQKNMRAHVHDARPVLYTPQQLETAESYDELWNATQNEMRRSGIIHGYYRMYWGKKVIEWSRDYQTAASFMIDIHGKYALDGRDPATYTNIFWCLGLHDRPWPERPVFGTFRYMTLEGMKRKSNTRAYIEQINSLKA